MIPAVASKPARPAREIRVNLRVPITRIGFGPYSVDPLEQLIGAPLADILDSLMTGPKYRRPSCSCA